ncbi:PAS domain S-box protein [Desulfuromonas acetoxidans]|uniref:two-component system sensor histidine kinase NtrB n=1 Tax=Desulfuromonas acetoxidans TaxID=891 RepID=UPI00159496EC|nr:ATP-binding protein [Desulfuromonas acetoxidans]MBF0644682.1 PAS domain S-box protein [Desulfuromonas acetoxidans]NVE15892.1 PAS domain S-box protein [Desulfuromonas acetoxidans]
MTSPDFAKSVDNTALIPSVSTLLWYLMGRAFIVILFLGGTVFLEFPQSLQALFAPDIRLIFLLSLTFFQICFSLLWLLRWQNHLRQFVQFQLVWDLLLSVLTVYVTGGVASLFSFLFIFVILSSALMATRTDVMVTVGASVVLYGGLVDLQYYGYLHVGVQSLQLTQSDVFYRLFLNVTAFLLSGFLGTILAGRLRRSELLLQQERNDYAELERLNRIILQNIPSGLIVVDHKGIIRSFNSAAASICGLAVSKVLRGPLTNVFPCLKITEMNLPVERGEFEYVKAEGDKRILGYNAFPFSDFQKDEIGILMTFQDLTETKRLEHNLQLGERLAAIGKLAAGLAHEIRNPLASLSGSVQLLTEQAGLDESDQHLLEIVNRETSRLNRLLGDFLVFARPRVPEKAPCSIKSLINEVCELAKTDPRFTAVKLEVVVEKDRKLPLDSGQIHQALWNLLVNAAQFSLAPKLITIGFDSDTCTLWVDDNGPGVSSDEKKMIFEPFYSSRAEGTGLGLSIIHAIVTAHRGTVECVESPWGGARFQINFNLDEAKKEASS